MKHQSPEYFKLLQFLHLPSFHLFITFTSVNSSFRLFNSMYFVHIVWHYHSCLATTASVYYMCNTSVTYTINKNRNWVPVIPTVAKTVSILNQHFHSFILFWLSFIHTQMIAKTYHVNICLHFSHSMCPFSFARTSLLP